MKRTLLGIALVAANSQTVAAELYNGRISGMAGAGYVTSQYADGLLYNPSLTAAHDDKDRFAIVLNGGGLISDYEDLQDGLEDLVDFTDYLQNATNLVPSDADTLKELMANVDEKSVEGSGSASLVIAIPNSYIPAALVVKVRGSLGGVVDIDEGDYALIDNSVNEPFEPEDLQSSVYGRGVLLRETGISLAKGFALGGDQQVYVGVTPKQVKVETIVYSTTVADYDEDELDADDYTVEGSASNFDAGITYESGNLRYGLSVQNVKSDSFRTVAAEVYKLDTRTTGAIGYTGERFKAEAAFDLDAYQTFGLGGESQVFRVGAEVDALSWLQLRAGLQRDMEDTLPDAFTFGLGISPYGIVNIDVAGFTGADDHKGGAIQIGLRL